MSLQFFLNTRVYYLNYQLNFMTPPNIREWQWQIKGRGPGAAPHFCGNKSKEVANLMVILPQNHCQFIPMSRAWGRKAHFSEAKFKPPNASFISFVFSLQLAFHDLYSVFHFVNPLTPGAFCLKRFFLDILEIFWLNTGHISFNLVKTASTT